MREAVRAAYRKDDYAGAARALTELARQWPRSPENFYDSFVGRIVIGSKKLADPQIHLRLLEALYEAHYKLDYGIEPSGFWADLALEEWARGEHAKAVEVFAHVESPYTLIWAQVDNRFAGLRAQLKRPIDVDAATAANLSRWPEIADANPRNLRPLYLLATVLIGVRQDEDALNFIDQVVEHIESSDPNKPAFKDLKAEYAWLLNERARALFHMGRFDEAIQTMVEATQRSEESGPNVSQRINLAGMYNDLGRSREALAQLDAVFKASSYGGMQVQAERCRAAIEMKDLPGIDKALGYLREHQADSPATYERALIWANRLDEAEALLISRLQDPVLRQSALLDVQLYLDNAVTPREIEGLTRWRAVIARPTVRAAVAQVGTVASFNIVSPVY